MEAVSTASQCAPPVLSSLSLCCLQQLWEGSGKEVEESHFVPTKAWSGCQGLIRRRKVYLRMPITVWSQQSLCPRRELCSHVCGRGVRRWASLPSSDPSASPVPEAQLGLSWFSMSSALCLTGGRAQMSSGPKGLAVDWDTHTWCQNCF